MLVMSTSGITKFGNGWRPPRTLCPLWNRVDENLHPMPWGVWRGYR
jgi:hypothetical protein